MLYIRQVRVQSPGNTNEHITDVKYSSMTTGPLTTVGRDTIISAIDGGGNVSTHNDVTLAEARVITREGANRRKYITTVADGRETNNLLELPRFA